MGFIRIFDKFAKNISFVLPKSSLRIVDYDHSDSRSMRAHFIKKKTSFSQINYIIDYELIYEKFKICHTPLI